jgi:hypothetical protein
MICLGGAYRIWSYRKQGNRVAEVNNYELEVWIDVSFIEKKPIKISHAYSPRGYQT